MNSILDIIHEYQAVPRAETPQTSKPHFRLSEKQELSSIPKVTSDGSKSYWKFPSEKIYWNALNKKGWRWEDHQHLTQEDLVNVLKNNNTMMDKAWQKVLKWEALHLKECNDPKLKCFRGEKVHTHTFGERIKKMFGYDIPHEKQDWIVDRGGKEVRYVIENYINHNGKQGTTRVNVRPALDSIENITDRIKMVTFNILPESANHISKLLSFAGKQE